MFTDTHSHLHFRQHFSDIEALLERAKAAQVTTQIIVGCTFKDSLQAVDFVKKYSDQNFYSTLGVHPHNADEWTSQVVERFRHLLQTEDSIKALGEMGLDYFRNLQPRELQHTIFRAQLQLAGEFDLPVIVHIREAWDDALRILAEEGNTKVVLHCFTGTMKEADIAWERGYFTSFSGVLTYPKNDYLREVVEKAPASQILLETDCPYLPPQAFRGKRNEPSFMVETAQEIARIRNIPLEAVADLTTANAKRIFLLE